MKKILCAVMSVLVIVSVFASCKNDSPAVAGENRPVRITALKGPTGMGLAGIISKKSAEYSVELLGSSEMSAIVAEIQKGECDIAAVPVNFASVLYNKTNGAVKVISANTAGVLYMLQSGKPSEKIEKISDLRGKTVVATGQGATPEYILRYVLKENGIDPDKDITLEFVADHAELASKLASDILSVGMLPEPNVSAVLSANPDVRVIFDMTEEWDRISGGVRLIQGVFVARSSFIEEHPDKVEKFLADFAESANFVNGSPDKAAAVIAECGILPNAAIAEKAIPRCNIIPNGKNDLDSVTRCLSVLFEFSPQSVGGKLPPEDFRYGKSK